MQAAKGHGRGTPTACIHRDRPIEESVREFERMKEGHYPEKAAALRMKIDLSSGNPYMWDPVCYRVKTTPHHKTGDQWSEQDRWGSKGNPPLMCPNSILLRRNLPIL